MSLTPWRKPQSLARTGGTPMSTLHGEMSSLFDQFFGAPTFGGDGLFSGANFPAIAVVDKDDSICVTAEVPGIDADDLNIRVDGDMLFLSGVKREETREERENLLRVERAYGSFSRRIALPGRVDPGKVQANVKNGVLRLEMPKMAGESGKTIKVKAS